MTNVAEVFIVRKRIFSIILTLCFILSDIGIVRYVEIPEVNAEKVFLYEEDTWGFSASELIDGDVPYLTFALKRKIISGKSNSELQRIESHIEKPLTDISYGMSLLELLFYNGLWEVSDISNTADVLHDVKAPIRRDVLLSFINYCNLLQYTDDITSLDEKALSEGSCAALENAETAVSDGKPALIRVHSSSSDDVVTAVIYGCEQGIWRYNGTRYNYRLLLSNTLNTLFSDESCIYYNKATGEWTIPDMGLSDRSGAVLGAVIDDINVLSKNCYDPEKLPKMMIDRVFVSPEELDIPITLSQSGIPESAGISMDLDFSPAAQEILHPSYESESYDVGSALPANFCSNTVNDNDFIIISVVTPMAKGGIICEENTPIISYLMDCADESAVRATAEKYNIPIQHDDEHGDYYAFPMCFGTYGIRSYYCTLDGKEEFPIVMDSEVCVVVKSKETTLTTTMTTTTTATSLTTIETTSATTTTTTVTESITATDKTSLTSTSILTTKGTSRESESNTSTTITTVTTSLTNSSTVSKISTVNTTSDASDTADKTSTTVSDTTSESKLKTSTSTTVTTTTGVQTTTTKLNFDWGKDNWQYSHDLLVPEYIADGYRITNSHKENLMANLSPMERVRIQNILEREWLGAEYGLAVTEVLAKGGTFSVPMWDPRVKNIYDLDLNDERNLSLISYYQLLQESDSVQQEIAWTSAFMSKKYVLSQLISSVSNSSKSGDMTVVCFFSKDYAHAAIAYGMEYGSWSLGQDKYDSRNNCADPYLDNFSNESCLYFNSSTLEWCIPSLNMNSADKDTFIGLASNSISLINDGGYFMGTSAYTYQHEYIPILEVPVDTEDFIISHIGSSENKVMENSELNWFSTAAASITHRRAGLDYDTDGFEIYPVKNCSVDYQMSFEKYLLSVKADNAESVTLLSDGIISLAAVESDFELSITTESELRWDSITIAGSNANDITAEHTGDGVILTGNYLNDIKIKADSISRKMDALSNGRTYTKAFIYEEYDGSIGVRVDADGDGECETVLEDTEFLKCGDLNIDGIVSVVDMVYMTKYLLGSIKMNRIQMKNADCFLDGDVSSADASVLLLFMGEKQEKIPVIPDT